MARRSHAPRRPSAALPLVVASVSSLTLGATPHALGEGVSCSWRHVFLGQHQSETLEKAADVRLVGTLAYVAMGDGLKIIDVSDPTAPSLVGSFEVLGGFERLTVGDDLAYASAFEGEIWIFDVSDPSDIQVVSIADTRRTPGRVRLSGSHALVGAVTLFILDVTDPTNPVEVSETSVQAVQDIAVVGSMVYGVGHSRGLKAIDISSPTSPTLVSGPEIGVDIEAIEVSGGLAYCCGRDGIRIYDLSIPHFPTLIGSLDADLEGDFELVGSTLYAPADRIGIGVFDVSDPTAPTFVGTYPVGRDPGAIEIQGTIAYVANRRAGLVTLDLTVPPADVETWITREHPLAAENPFGVWFHGDVAFVSGTSSVEVLDYADPASPIPLGEFPTPRRPIDFVFAGDVAFVMIQGEGVSVYDLSVPGELTSVGSIPKTSLPQDLLLVDTTLFVIESSSLRIFDVADPAQPDELGSYPLSHALSICARGSTGFVAQPSGLLVLDLSDLTAPQLITTYVSDWGDPFAGDVDLFGQFAYVLVGAYAIDILDISSPHAPQFVGRVFTAASNFDLDIVGGGLYTNVPPIERFDLTDPANPVLTGIMTMPGSGPLAGHADAVYVTLDGTLGLIDFSDCCPADINNDGDTSVLDFAPIAGRFGEELTPFTGPDLDGDGKVTVFDFVTFLIDFGCSP